MVRSLRGPKMAGGAVAVRVKSSSLTQQSTSTSEYGINSTPQSTSTVDGQSSSQPSESAKENVNINAL